MRKETGPLAKTYPEMKNLIQFTLPRLSVRTRQQAPKFSCIPPIASTLDIVSFLVLATAC